MPRRRSPLALLTTTPRPSSAAGCSITNTGSAQDVKVDSGGHIIDCLGSALSNNLRAIAILGLETPPNLNQRDIGSGKQIVFAFASINGVAVDKAETTGTNPDNINGTDHTSYANVISGKYDLLLSELVQCHA